jgi:hypothetical protein
MLDDSPFDPFTLHWNFQPETPSKSHQSAALDVSALPKQAPAEPSPHATFSTALMTAASPKDSKAQPKKHRSVVTHAAERKLEVTVSAARWKGNHERYLEYTPFWSKFRVDTSMVQNHLSKKVPMFGLSDIAVQRPSKPTFLVKDRKKELEREPTLMELYELSKREAERKENS